MTFLFGLVFWMTSISLGALVMSIAMTIGVDAVHAVGRWRRDRRRRHVYRLPLPTCRVWGGR